jgi:catechol 2,3-dioxygenase-like lactoylglutathione lyase family enzyme
MMEKTETDVQAKQAIIGGAILTHGTLESRNLDVARALYESVLGLRCVRHSPRSQLLAGRGGVAIVCVETGTAVHPQGDENRWVVLAGGDEAVLAVHDAAAKSDAVAQLGTLERDGATSRFVMQDVDTNWWEVTSRSPHYYRHIFERGDQSLP